MLFTSPDTAEFISGVIMYDETIRPKNPAGARHTLALLADRGTRLVHAGAGAGC
jgi:hypothetical protein